MAAQKSRAELLTEKNNSTERRSDGRGALRTRILALVLVSSAANGTSGFERLQTLPADKCTVSEVTNALLSDQIQALGNNAEKQMPLHKEMEQIADKGKDNSKPLSAQISPADVQRFGEIRQQLIALTGQKLVESRRERDIELIYQMAQVSDTNYRWQKEYGEKDQEYHAQRVLYLLRELDSEEPIGEAPKPASTTSCTMYYALTQLQLDSTKRMQANSPDYVLKRLIAWNTKYHTKTVDTKLLNPQELIEFTKINNEWIVPLKLAATNYKDIEALKIMDYASVLMYEGGKQDLLEAGGDTRTIGDGLSKRIAAHAVSQSVGRMVGMWRLIEEKLVPSQASQDIKASADYMKLLKKK